MQYYTNHTISINNCLYYQDLQCWGIFFFIPGIGTLYFFLFSLLINLTRLSVLLFFPSDQLLTFFFNCSFISYIIFYSRIVIIANFFAFSSGYFSSLLKGTLSKVIDIQPYFSIDALMLSISL